MKPGDLAVLTAGGSHTMWQEPTGCSPGKTIGVLLINEVCMIVAQTSRLQDNETLVLTSGHRVGWVWTRYLQGVTP
jgi:hypothetical protein